MTPAAVLLPFGEGFPFPPAYEGAIPHSLYQTFPEKTTKNPKIFVKSFKKMMDRTGNLYYYINENGQKKRVCPL